MMKRDGYAMTVEGITEPQTAEELLALLGALRREAGRLESEIATAKARLERSEEWCVLDDLKRRRKEVLQELDDALGDALGDTLAYHTSPVSGWCDRRLDREATRVLPAVSTGGDSAPAAQAQLLYAGLGARLGSINSVP